MKTPNKLQRLLWLIAFASIFLQKSNAQVSFGTGLATGSNVGTSGTARVFIGNGAGLSNTSGASNTFLGDASGTTNVAASNNTFVGTESGYANYTGTDNTAVGRQAGHNNISGIQNAFFGSGSGYHSGSDYNSFFGMNSGYFNNGVKNSMFGSGVGYTSSGNYNSFFGYLTGFTTTGDYNVFLGDESAVSNTSGGSNVFVGAKSAASNISGSYNVFLGEESAGSNTTGYENVMIGYLTGASATNSIFDNVFIGTGSGSLSTGNNNTFLGSGTTGYGSSNVLLGAYSAASAGGSVTNAVAIGTFSSVTASNTMSLGGTGSYGLTVVINQTYPVGLTGAHTVAGTTGVGNDVLEVNGDALFQGGIYIPSDQRLKRNIQDITNARDIIRNLHPVRYEYRDDMYFTQQKDDKSKPVKMEFSKGTQIGFLAQELEKFVPEAVITRGDGYKAVNYNHLFGLLVEGMQEQSNEIDSLKKVTISMNDRLSALEQLIKKASGTVGNSIGTSIIGGTIANPTLANPVQKQGYLEQNFPNPFSDNTVVKYFVPETAGTAKVSILSDRAIEVMAIAIDQKGMGSLTISGNTLTMGTYTMQLIVDGNIVDVKKILVIK